MQGIDTFLEGSRHMGQLAMPHCTSAVWQAHQSRTVSALSCRPAVWRALPDFGLLKGSAPACVTFARPLLRLPDHLPLTTRNTG